jgi:hypothetical protein
MVSSCFQPSAIPASRSRMPGKLGRNPAIAWSGTASGTPVSSSTANPTRITMYDRQRNTAPRMATTDPSTAAAATTIANRRS